MTTQPSGAAAAYALGAGTTHRGLRVVDVACGSGVWGIAVAEADQTARVTAQDFAAVLATTRGASVRPSAVNCSRKAKSA